MSINVYTCKDGRERVYIKETKKVMSYPKYLMEQKLGRPLLPNEEIHHKDENPLNNNLNNLEIRFHGEHQSEHSTIYHDTTAICGWCGKEFLWSGKQQRTFYANRRYDGTYSEMPFCSRQCSGYYGRHVQGDSPRRKLTDEQVRYIRKHYTPHNKQCGITTLASKFGVSRRAIYDILNGETYRNCK